MLSTSFKLKCKKKKKTHTHQQKKPAFKNICCLSLAGRRAQTQNLYNCEKNERKKKKMFCVLKGLFFLFLKNVQFKWAVLSEVMGGGRCVQQIQAIHDARLIQLFPRRRDGRGCTQAQWVNALRASADATCKPDLRVCGHHMWKVKRRKRVFESTLSHRSSRIHDFKKARSSHFKTHRVQKCAFLWKMEDKSFPLYQNQQQRIIICKASCAWQQFRKLVI